MADNTTLPAGAGGDVIADEDIAGVKYQKVKLIDPTAGSTTPIGTGANPLNVSLPAGFATAANQALEVLSLANIDSKITAVNTGAVVVSSSALPSGASTAARQDTGNTSLASIDGKITAVNTGAVVVSSSALPSGAATGAKQDTGNVSLASIDAKLTNPLPVSGTVAISTALNLEATQLLVKAKTDNLDVALSTRALESGGNLATIAAKDFATQTTLATIAAAVKGEDTAAVDADKGIPTLAIRQDVPANTTSDAGDYGNLKQDIRGRLWVADDIQEPIVRAQGETLLAILTELRVMNNLLQTGLNVRDDVDALRSDAYFNASQT